MIKIEVTANGSVVIEQGSRTVAMSRFGYSARVIAGELGVGTYEFPPLFTDDNDCPAVAWDAAMAALA